MATPTDHTYTRARAVAKWTTLALLAGAIVGGAALTLHALGVLP